MSKSYWNYRVVVDEDGSCFVTDVYYTDHEPHSWGEFHGFFGAESVEELEDIFHMVIDAFNNPPVHINSKQNKVIASTHTTKEDS